MNPTPMYLRPVRPNASGTLPVSPWSAPDRLVTPQSIPFGVVLAFGRIAAVNGERTACPDGLGMIGCQVRTSDGVNHRTSDGGPTGRPWQAAPTPEGTTRAVVATRTVRPASLPSQTVSDGPVPVQELISGGQVVMAKRPRLAKVAVVRGEFALLVFQDAARDKVIDENEMPAVLDALEDWLAVARATNAAQALGDAIERGVEDPRYFGQLMNGYRSVIDELPTPA